MYEWRRLTPEERDELLRQRQQSRLPWHSPPHANWGNRGYLVSAACFEHRPIIGALPHRMAEFESQLLQAVAEYALEIHAWCVLPNHYHVLLQSAKIEWLLKKVGEMHGRISYTWNGIEKARGRQVWYRCVERAMRNDGHFWSTLNYVHHNPVHHRYCQKWQEWPFASARLFLEEVGREEAIRVWEDYPLLDYGKGWDDPDF
jgi:putative transposase